MQSFKGLLAAVCAFSLWGFLPVYWKQLEKFPAQVILCHRMIWSLFVTLALLLVFRRMNTFISALKQRENLKSYTLTALLLSVNWFLFIWSVNSGFIVEASLGYFITPLINVFFGMIFFQEKMRPMQLLALSFAFLGVLYLTLVYGRFPWIALILAVTFALYGFYHKKNRMPALDGLCLETLVLALPAIVLLTLLSLTSQQSYQVSASDIVLLMGCGVATTAPLLFFGFAAQNIHLSSLGMLQYLSPTINLILGIFVYGEEFPHARFVGFLLIWLALALFVGEGVLVRFRHRIKP